MSSPYSLDTTKLLPPRVFLGEIVSVDEENFLCSAVRESDQGVETDIPLMATYLNDSAGQGIYVMPEVGSKVYILYPSDSSKPTILGFRPAPDTSQEFGDDDADDGVEIDSNESSHRNRRPPMQEGDILLMSREGAHVVLRRSGVLEMGAGPACKKFYFPLNNLIREFAESYELHTTGGSFRLANDREPYVGTYSAAEGDPSQTGAERVPGLLQLHVKQFTDDIPVVKLDAGYVEEDHGKFLPNARKKQTGRIVYRLAIGASDDSRLGDQMGEIISENYLLRIDREGVIFERSDAGKTFTCESFYNINVENGAFSVKASKEQKHITGGSEEIVEQVKILNVQKGMRTLVGITENTTLGTSEFIDSATNQLKGSPTYSLVVNGGATSITTGFSTVESGPSTVKVNGASTVNIGGPSNEMCSEDKQSVVGGSFTEGITKHSALTVSNSEYATDGYRVHLNQGAMVLRNSLGDIQIFAGTQTPFIKDAAASALELKTAGSAELHWASRTAKLIGMSSGAWRIGTDSSYIQITADGTLHLNGPGAMGGVITTMTHPVCFVTGAPIMGSTSVVASSGLGTAVGPALTTASVKVDVGS
tara:strand:+ start:5075 stop:6850 length:1776 start_codon:yes stop_codon:yes gene_type:complete